MVVQSFKMCFNCLKTGHQVNECSNKTRCQVSNCKRHHEHVDIPVVSTDQIGLLIGVQVTEAMIQHEYRLDQRGNLMLCELTLDGRLLA